MQKHKGLLTMSSLQAEAAGDDETSPVSGPLVFSCGNCRTIVGDSFSFLCSNEADKTITLSAASNVKRGTQLFTSYDTLDEGNSYFDFECIELRCRKKLGRYYVTTSKDLDHIREKFTFSVDAITSYELGKAQFGHIPDAEVIELPATEDVEAEVAVASVETVQEDVSKIHHVLVDLVQRVNELERELNALKRERGEAHPSNGSEQKRARK